ncbi:MAG TPA: choice-of-anchor J domain-containing protein [Tenuifilaceae bacterium]|nr:choice-of-anchor J domain-containing protein [Tenuifilaceae bacterium]
MRKALTLLITLLLTTCWLYGQETRQAHYLPNAQKDMEVKRPDTKPLENSDADFVAVLAEPTSFTKSANKGTVQIGSGTTTTSYFPIYAYYGYSYTQQIYLKSEIATAGAITKIRFYLSSTAPNNSNQWVVYMGHTTKTEFTSTTEWVPFANLTEVFNGTVTFPASGNWMEINLSTPFNYNNTDNLVIAVDENAPSYGATTNWLAFNSGTNRGIYYRDDTTNPNPATPPTAYSTTTTINQVQLYFPMPYDFSITYPAGVAVWAGESHNYSVTIKNEGDQNDTFTPAIVGDGEWTYGLFQADGTTPLTGSVAINSGATYNFIVKVTVPATGVSFGETDTENFTVTSAEGGKVVKNFSITTSALVPIIPSYLQGFDDVEFPPLGWTRTQLATGGGNWTRTTPGANTTAGTMFHNYASGNHNSWIVSPPILLTAGYECTLSFYERNLYVPADYEYSGVLISTGSSTAGSPDFVEIYESSATISTFTLKELDISAYAGNTVYIAFVYEGDFAHSWYVDEVKITAVLIPDVDAAAVSVDMYPFTGTGILADVMGTVKNRGKQNDTFDVSVSITNAEDVEVYTDVKSVTLDPDQVGTVTFDQWQPVEAGAYTVTMTTLLAGDEVPENDEVTATVTVVDYLLWGKNIDYTNSTSGIVSTNLGGITPGLIETADDFIIPDGTWLIGAINAKGFRSPSTTIDPTRFMVIIYEDNAGVPGDIVHQELVPVTSVTSPVLTFAEPLILENGHYWLTVAGHYPTGTVLSSTRWNWTTWNRLTEHEASLRDQPNVFGDGSDWATLSDFGIANAASTSFSVYGTDVPFIFPEDANFIVDLPEDVSTHVYWLSASSITSINDGDIDLVEDTDYTIENDGTYYSTLTFSVEYLSTKFTGVGSDDLVLTITFDTGDEVEFTITPEILTITGIATFNPLRVILGVPFEDLDLPEEIEVELNNGTTTMLDIVWSAGTYNPATPGTYTLKGEIVLVDGVPANPSNYEATINVIVLYATNYINENFDAITGIPANWTSDFLNTAAVGVDGTRALRRNMYSASTSTGYWQTPVVAVGDDPEFSFMYKVINYTGGTATPAANFSITVRISNDLGATFTNVHVINADNHTPSTNFAPIDIDMSGYAGGYVVVRVEANRFDGDFYMIFDDVKIGSFYTGNFTITDGTDPIENATIKIGGLTATTDAQGEASMIVPNGTNPLQIAAAGFLTYNGTLTVDGDDVDFDLAMISMHTITFNVLDDADGPISGVAIAYTGTGVGYQGAVELSGSLTTNASGVATVILPNGEYTFTAYKIGYLGASGAFEVSGADLIVPTIVLSEAPPTFSYTADWSGGANFGKGLANLYTKNQTFTFTNIGTGPLEVDMEDFAIEGADAEMFVFAVDYSGVTHSLTTGQSATVIVQFAPTAGGVFNAQLVYEDVEVELFGEAYAPVTLPFVEDFEGGTFDNWIVVNGTQTNQWHVGIAAGDTDNLSAMVSNDNGVTNAYTIGSTSVVHFYMDFAIPEIDGGELGDVVLAFDWKCMGEKISLDYDYLRVYSIAPTVTPVAGTLLTGELGTYNMNASWQRATLNIPVEQFGTTRRIVFSWRNDSSGGTQPPAAVDNILIGEPFDVSFAVSDQTGAEIPNATITLNGIVNAEGNYTFENLILLPGDYEYSVNAPGHEGFEGVITLNLENIEGYEVVLNKFYNINFTVTDYYTHAPLADAIFEFDGAAYDLDEHGKVTLEVLNGDYNYSLMYAGYSPVADEVTVLNGNVNVNILLVPAAEILTFTIPEQVYPADIDWENGTIEVMVNFEANMAALTPTIGLSPGATVDPESGVAQDFNSPVVYTVTGFDGTDEVVKEWTVTVAIADETATRILTFTFEDASIVDDVEIDYDLSTIDVYVVFGTNIAEQTPTVTISFGASINPIPGYGDFTDFEVPVTYTVTAADGVTVADWVVTIHESPNTAADIEAFTLAEEIAPADIDNEELTVKVRVAVGTDRTKLTPTIEISENATILPASGVEVDLSEPFEYLVTSQSGVEKTWTAYALNWDASLSVITVAGTPVADFDAEVFEYTVEVPYGTTTAPVVLATTTDPNATYEVENAEEMPGTTVITATAEDGIATLTYSVEFTIAPPNTDATLANLTVNGVAIAGFDPDVLEYEMELPYGTIVVPTVVGTPTDPNATVVVTPAAALPGITEVLVTAEDGETELTYTVEFTIAPPTLYELPFAEDFTGIATGAIPTDWTRTHSHWGVVATNNAGGTSPEMRFYWSPTTTATFRLTTPFIDATNFNGDLYMSFRHRLDWFSNTFNISAQITTDAGATWDVLWNVNATADIPAQLLEFDLNDYKGEIIQIAFVYVGNSYDVNYWNFDDLYIGEAPEKYTLTLVANPTEGGTVTGGGEYFDGVSVPVSAVPNTDFLFVNWTDEDGDVVSGNANFNYIMPAEDVTLTANFLAIEYFSVTVNVSTNTDESPAGAVVVLTNQSGDPNYVYTLTAPANGVVVFDEVCVGMYNLSINLAGYNAYLQSNIDIDEDLELDALLIETIVEPFGLLVETEGLEAGQALFSWNNVFGPVLFANFEEGALPAGWTQTINNTDTSGPAPGTWTVTDYSSTTFAPFGTYHVGLWWSYDYQDEWLITPEIAIGANFELEFWSAVYLGSPNGDHYYVEVSTDGGNTWTAIWDASALSGEWNYYDTPIVIDLAAYAGQNVHFAFHAEDPPSNDGLWYIWFIDNVSVGMEGVKNTLDFANFYRYSGKAQGNNTGIADAISKDGSTWVMQGTPSKAKSLLGYNVYLNDVLVTDEPIEDEEFLFTNLPDGDYIAGVQSVFTSGESSIVTIPFTIEGGVTVYTVTFTVINSETEAVLEGVEITIGNGTITTDAEGMATISLPDGTYEFTADAGEYYDVYEGSFTVEGEDLAITVPMNPVGITPNILASLEVYPNPFNHQISVRNAEGVNRVVITNLIGQVVMDIPLTSETINTSDLGKGVYMITFIAENGERAIRKMIKQ